MKTLGVIVARFQVPSLHEGHVYLLEEVAKQSDSVLILLGYKVNQPDIKNPFPVSVRLAMVRQKIKELGIKNHVIVDVLEDNPVSNNAWSADLDNTIRKHEELLAEKFGESISSCLYGSRDSFLLYYHGAYTSSSIDQKDTVSGTEMRERVLSLDEENLSNEHREGMVYGLKYIYPVGMSVVDVLIYKRVKDELCFLLGRKHREKDFRIIGGFFDVTKDTSLEDAALREMKEEVGELKVAQPVYVMSKKIDDWRYRDNQHKIVSSLFVIEYVQGEPKAGDDIEEVLWVRVKDLATVPLHSNHCEFIDKAVMYLDKLQ